MNNIGNLDYSINTTIKDNKLIIEYSGSVFKDNPSLVTKQNNSLRVKETSTRFEVEMDLKKKKELNFSINNVNNKETRNQINQPLSLIVLEKDSLWNRIKLALKKINFLGVNRINDKIEE